MNQFARRMIAKLFATQRLTVLGKRSTTATRILLSSVAAASICGSINAQDIQPVGGFGRKQPVLIPCPPNVVCPVPSNMAPAMPGTPGVIVIPIPGANPANPANPELVVPGNIPNVPVDTGILGTAEAPSAGTATGGNRFTPNMMGDLPSRFTTSTTRNPVRILATNLQGQSTTATGTKNTTVTAAQIELPAEYATTLRVPYIAAGAFKISENESPRPADRLYVNFNYFNGLRRSSTPLDPSLGRTSTSSLTNFGIPTLVNPMALDAEQIQDFNRVASELRRAKGLNSSAYNAYIRGVLASRDALNPSISDPLLKAAVNVAVKTAKSLGAPDSFKILNGQIIVQGGPFGAGVATTVVEPEIRNIAMYRETFGFEKTFLNGDASIGMRLPLLQTTGDGSFNGIGDLSIVAKYAFYNNQQTGNLASLGMVVTAPTGDDFGGIDGQIHTTLLQPYVGVIYNFRRFFYQGFSAITIPTNSNDVTFLGNDFSLAYRLYENQSRLVTAIIPAVECHVTTPLNKRNEFEGGFLPDIVSFTGALHCQMGQRSVLSMGVNAPVTGPRPYNYEVFAQFNYAFGPNPGNFLRNPPIR